jgi:carbon-monoxide dehydrogenase medium subunit
MATIRAYHRPESLEEALALLAGTEADATILAGGTVVNGRPEEAPTDVVDLQALGLDAIRADGDRLELGSMVRLSDLAASDLAPALLRDLAKREAPNTLRNAATVGGTIAAADPESELLAGLLAFEATVTVVQSIGSESIPLDELLADRSRLGLGIITSAVVEVGGDAVAERTGRTPADRPIVTAVARRAEDGSVRLALTGVDKTPVLVDPAALDGLEPPADFRGSTVYRKELAGVLARRTMNRLGEDV